jgi:hypothetical protein
LQPWCKQAQRCRKARGFLPRKRELSSERFRREQALSLSLPFSRFFQLAAAPATLEKATLSPVRAQEAQQDAVSLPLPPPSASAFSTLSKKPKSTEEKEGKHSAYLVLDLEAGRCRGAAGDDAALKQLEKKVLFFQVEKKAS